MPVLHEFLNHGCCGSGMGCGRDGGPRFEEAASARDSAGAAPL